MIKLHPKLKDPKWQAFAEWNKRGEDSSAALKDFIVENKIPKKHVLLASLALTVVKWSMVTYGTPCVCCGMCAMIKYLRIYNCSDCIVAKLCIARDITNPEPTFNRLYALYKAEYEKEFGSCHYNPSQST